MAPTPAPGLYVHLPFCSAICPYCDFAVLRGDAIARRRFVDHLLVEVGGWRTRADLADAAGATASTPEEPAWAWPHREPFDTVYLGGGTPSHLGVDELERLLASLRTRLAVSADAWISLEANPEDVTAATCADWRRLGVRTLSLGVQSFADTELAFLGRRHDGGDAQLACETALASGFEVVSIDLIFGLSGQTADAWRRSLELAAALGPQHVSCYQLTIHTGTPFGFRHARGRLAEMPEAEQAGLFRLTHERLAAHGYAAYEVSNFAREPHHRSRHNRKYWQHVPYLGVGPGAHSLALPAGERPTRFWNVRKTPRYERAVAATGRAVDGSEQLSVDQLAVETLLLGLRTVEGVDLAAFAERFGLDLLNANQPLVDCWIAERLVRREALPARLALTLDGFAVADGLAAALRTASPAVSGLR